MEIPRRVGKRGRFLANSSSKPSDGYSEIVCRVIPIMDRLFSKHPRLVVNQVNNSSYIDNYLLTKMFDHILRLFFYGMIYPFFFDHSRFHGIRDPHTGDT